MLNRLPPEVILWGGTGQAKVSRPIIEHCGARIVGVFDDTPFLPRPFPDVELHLGWRGFKRWIRQRGRDELGFCIAIGNPHGRVRLQLHERLVEEGLQPVTIAHWTAHVADSACLESGSQVMAGAVISENVRIGRQCIVNTNASVDHDSVLEDGVEVAPGATLCGEVRVMVNGWICAGATLLPRVSIGPDAIVGAGAVVTRDVASGDTVVGTPARPLRKRIS